MRRALRSSQLGVVGLLSSALVFGGCATVVNPVTGEREWSTLSPERERALGAQGAAQVEAEIGLVADPELAFYVDAIGQRLARHSPRQDVAYRFAVVDMAEPNAFALPGGWIYVSRGLLAISNSEDELANVIGHEIGHVAARHADQRQTRATGVGLLTVLGTVLAGAAGGDQAAAAVAQIGQTGGAGYIASYGREQERQSDEVGQRIAAQSGWDPSAMARFLDTLEREAVLRSGARRQASFLDSHPVTRERVENTAARARTLDVVPNQPVARSREDFFSRFDGILVGPDPAHGTFRGALFLHPDLDFVVGFPSDWPTQNSKQSVAARSPSGDAVILLELQGPSGDPAVAARAFAQQNQLVLQDGRPLRIGGWNAYQASALVQGQQSTVALNLTWIAHPQAMFRLSGMSSPQAFAARASTFLATAQSFRSLSRAERGSITERRLRVVAARRGESLAALSLRTGNAWTLQETAVANGLDSEAVLDAGAPIKIAVEVPYRP
jgi:predicted Zn-dependent protease